MSSPSNKRAASGTRKRGPAPPSNRDPYGNASLGSCSNSGSCKASDASPNHRRHVKYTSCNDNHGIRPPPPEQYLTPLQQKEVCIRHLRARLKETVDKLRDKDTEIDELRTLLSRMQEDWVEEECHRVEAQLALKEARREIQQLKQVAEDVRTNLGEANTGVQQCFQDINLQNHKLETLMHNMELAQPGPAKVGPCGGGVVEAGLEVSEGLAGSSDGSPAPSLTRSSTYTKLSDQVGPEHNSAGSRCDAACFSGGGTQDSGFVCCEESGKVMSKADLLLEAAILSQETASLLNAYSRLPHSSTCEALCSSEPRVVPLHYGGIGAGASVSLSHPCLSHHHLYLHHLREQAIQTDYDHAPASAPAHGPSTSFNSDLNTIAERTFRSQACSPTSTWMSDEGEDLESVAIESAVTHPSDSTKFLQAVTESLSSTPPFENQQEIATLKPNEPSVTKLTDSESLPILTIAYDNRDQTDLTSEATSSSLTSSVPLQPITDTVQSSCSSPCSVQPMAGTEVEPHPQTSQPRGSQPETAGDLVLDVGEVVEEDDVDGSAADAENTKSGCGLPTKSYWSRHFLVDLLAVVVPVVPTVAWFCRGPHRDGQPIYHIGSLLRGCCTVALHSLRRGGLRHYSAGGGGGTGGMNI